MAVIQTAQDEEKDQQAPTSPTGAPLQTISTAAPANQPTSTTAPARQQPQGSGRFTNLQKYLQANQAGGQRIAQQIGTKVSQQGQQQAEQAQKYYGQLGQSIEQAKQTAQAGAGYQQQLQGIGQQIGQATLTPEQIADQQIAQQRLAERGQQDLSGIEAFTQQPGFKQFQDIQAGRGIDEGLLSLQQQRALQSAQAAAQGSQQAQSQLGSEAGRFELLKQQFGSGPRSGYTQGQQRLDQILLGQGGGLGGLQAQTAAQTKANLEQARLATGQGQEVSRLATQEQGLISDIGSQSAANEQAYLNMLKSYVDPTNIQRQQEFEGLGKSLQTYIPTYDPKTKTYKQKPTNTSDYGLSSEQMANLGLTDRNTGVYNVFKDQAYQNAPGTNEAERLANIANVAAARGREAVSAQDIANQQDLTRYQALSKILGGEVPASGLTQVSDLGAAYTSKEGGLADQLTAAQKAFNAQAAKTKATVGDYYGGGMSATMKNILDKGEHAYNVFDDTIRAGGVNIADVYSGKDRLGYGRARDLQGIQRGFEQGQGRNLEEDFRSFINQQNYGQTLGGRRETYLDTLAAQRLADQGITGKIPDRSDITGTDPSAQYGNLRDLLTSYGTGKK